MRSGVGGSLRSGGSGHPVAASVSEATLKRRIAAAASAASPDFDFESAPDLELKGLGTSYTFHFLRH